MNATAGQVHGHHYSFARACATARSMAAGDDGGGAFLLDMLRRREEELVPVGRLTLRVKRDASRAFTDDVRRQMTAARILGQGMLNDEAVGEREMHQILRATEPEDENRPQGCTENRLDDNPQEPEGSARSRQSESS